MEEIICKKCGTHAAPDESFCGGCGAFLEWEGERVVVETVPPLGTGAAGTDHPAGPAGQGSSAGGTAHPGPRASGREGSAQEAPGQEASGQEGWGLDAQGQVSHTTSGGRPQPVPVKPAPTLERRPLPPPPTTGRARRGDPGDIVCGACGQFNVPTRRFCRRCGALLAEQDVQPVRLRWWQRLLGRGRKRPAGTHAAGGKSGAAATAGGTAGAGRAGPPGGGAPSTTVSGARAASQQPGFARPPAGFSGLSTGLPKRTHHLGKAVLSVAVVAALVIGLDPTLRSKVANEYHAIKYDVLPSYPKVPVERVVSTGTGHCGTAQLQGNDTVYWYTQPRSVSAQSLVITLATTFKGTVDRLAFTPLTPPNSPPPAGQASPNPKQLTVIATPGVGPVPITLDDPPKFQQATVKIKHASSLELRLVNSDPGAAPGTCAETAVVLYERKG